MSPWRVLGAGVGLLVIAGLTLFVGSVRGKELDGPARLATLFREGHVPPDTRLAAALLLPSGEKVVRLEREPAAEASSEEGGDGGSASWDELVLVEYPSMASVGRLFPRPQGDEGDEDDQGPSPATEASRKAVRWKKDPSFAFHAEVHDGRIAWDRWEAEVRVERAYFEGGGWKESARVNLGQQGRALVLFVTWPEKCSWSEAQLEELLRRIAMLPPKE